MKISERKRPRQANVVIKQSSVMLLNVAAAVTTADGDYCRRCALHSSVSSGFVEWSLNIKWYESVLSPGEDNGFSLSSSVCEHFMFFFFTFRSDIFVYWHFMRATGFSGSATVAVCCIHHREFCCERVCVCASLSQRRSHALEPTTNTIKTLN